MRDIKVIVSDLDRTLLRTDKSVSAYTLDVLRRAREKGLKFVAATARAESGFRLLDLSCDAAIVFNGALLLLDGSSPERFVIDAATADEIIRTILKLEPSAEIVAETVDISRANFDPRRFWPNMIYEPHGFAAPLPAPVYKILLPLDGFSKVEELEALLPRGTHSVICEDTFAMILSESASKLNAFKQLCELWDVPLEQTVMFGDDLNDVELLRAAGISVAVANAGDEAKQAATERCASNDDDGVARWIEKNLLS